MTFIATNFRTILDGLKVTLGAIAYRDANVRALVTLAWFHINRTTQRFERLVTRWQSGTLPKPRIRAPRAKRPTPTTQAPRLPRARAWLVLRLQDHHVNTRASQLQYFLANTPDLPAFLEAAPQARRLLRPLCTMLGVQMPGDAPPPAPRPSHPKPAKPPKRLPQAAPWATAQGAAMPDAISRPPVLLYFSTAR